MDAASLPPVPPSPVAPPAATAAAAGGTVFQPITVPAHMAGMIGAAPVAAGSSLRTTREIGDRLRAAVADFCAACEGLIAALRTARAHAEAEPRAAAVWQAEELDLTRAADVARQADEALATARAA